MTYTRTFNTQTSSYEIQFSGQTVATHRFDWQEGGFTLSLNGQPEKPWVIQPFNPQLPGKQPFATEASAKAYVESELDTLLTGLNEQLAAQTV